MALTEAHRHAARMARRAACRRGRAMFELLTGFHPDTLAPIDDPHPSTGAGTPGTSGASRASDTSGRPSQSPGGPGRSSGRPSVLLVAHVDALLDGTTPAWLLSPLAGRIRVTSHVARRWMHAQGADVRLVAVDDVGEVVGVGHRRRFATGWLRDAVVARDLHDTAPCSTTPAAFCDVDHVQAWPDGPTDLPNLTLVSRRWHTAKTNGHWTLTRHGDGTRTWTNTTSGFTIRQPRPQHLPGPPHRPGDDPPGRDDAPERRRDDPPPNGRSP